MKLPVCLVAVALLCTQVLGGERSSPDLMGLTKIQVVKRLGFPTIAHMIPSDAQGGPGFEIWQYYQRSPSGGLELRQVVFGNSTKNLGHVVGYAADIDPKRIITAETPDGLRAILEYNSKHGM